MIKLIDILKEEQKFDFEDNKKSILNYINDIKNKNPYAWAIEKTFYRIITGGGLVGSADKIGFTKDIKDKWSKIFKSSLFVSNGVWSEIAFNNQLARKTGLDKTLNFYITIDKTKDNVEKFVKAIPDLNKRIKEFSDKNQSPISWKTHTNLDSFVSHNDSLKVFYYDSDLKDDVERIVKEWTTQNNIKISPRTHSHGVDIRATKGGDKESFGQLIAQEWKKQFTALIEKYGNKYTDKQYYEWIKKYGPEIIKKINIKYK